MDTGHISRTPILFIQTEASKKKEKRGRSKKNKEKEGRIKDQFVANEKVIAVDNENVPSTDKMVVPTRNGKYDWYAMLPSLETLRNREHFRSKPSSNQRKSYIVNVLGREVLALPYIDVGLPDFLEYQYPKPERFYAEENFMYGASRPN
nr:Bm7720, isoform d [Brugia malayi]